MVPRNTIHSVWKHVDVRGPDECWPFTSWINFWGYGEFRIHPRAKVRAHIAAYESKIGPVPKGLVLDHLCRVRHCCNPAHLEPVTLAENVKRGGNSLKTHCPQGHEYTPENTVKRSRGSRECLTCNREYDRQRKPKR